MRAGTTMQNPATGRYNLRLIVPVLGIAVLEAAFFRSMQSAGDILPLLGASSLLSRVPASASWATLLTQNLVKVFIGGGLLWLFVFRTRLFEARHTLETAPAKAPQRAAILLTHGTALVCVAVIRARMNGVGLAGLDLPELWLTAGYLVGFLVLVATGLCLIAPPTFWRAHVRQLPIPAASVAFACLALSLAISLGLNLSKIEDSFDQTLFAATAEGVDILLRWWGYSVQIDVATRQLSVGDFSVLISPHCLGYEGVAIALTGLSVYLVLNRRHLRFPQALIVFPIVVVALFAANCLRIAALTAIGASWSPRVAAYGFHTAAGWINLLVIAGCSILLIERLPFLSRRPSTPSLHLDEGGYQLLPQVLLLAVAFVTLLFSPGFEWLYPVRVIAVGACLYATRRHLNLGGISNASLSLVAGLLVFLVWIALVGQDQTKSAHFEVTLFSVSYPLAIAWLGFRVLGAVVVVPIAEELAFRGYLLTACQKLFETGKAPSSPRVATSLALLVTSIGFGLLHADWIAGTLAGLTYGALRLHTKSIANAALAHATTNCALALYVLHGHAWSLW